MNYQQELHQNRLASYLEPTPLVAEWRVYKEQNLKYDPCYDYYAEVYPLEIKAFEHDHPEHKSNAEPAIQSFLSEPRPQPHYFIYTLWLSHKYKHFKKNWKPKNDDGLNFLHITFNFSDKITVNDVVLEMTSIVNNAVFKNCKLTWCYEYYTDHGCHPHIHMLVELNRTGTISPSTLKQKIFAKQSLKEILNINYKLSWAKEYKDRCEKRAVILAYITGNKIVTKNENSEKDKHWRKLNNLEDLYIKET